MPSRKKSKETLKKKKRRLQAQLLSLESGHPSYTSTKKALETELQLVKAQLKSPKRTAGSGKGKSRTASTAKGKGKKPPLPGGASFPSFQLPKPKSPTFYEDSIKSIGSLRDMTKKGLTYMQRADQLFESLHGVGSQLQQSGVLPKLMQGKVKDLSTGEWSALLMALLNSPLSGFLLGGGGGGEETAKAEGGDNEGDDA